MKEHLVKAEQQKEMCMYCGRSIAAATWDASHCNEVLYRTTMCECGKKAVLRMSHHGSGHDSFGKQGILESRDSGISKLRTIESKLTFG